MARIDAAANGTILRFLSNAAQEAEHPGAHPGTDEQLTLDERSNATLIADLLVSTDPYRLSGGVLTKNDTPVTINPEGEQKASTSDFAAQYDAALTRLNQIIDFQGTPTAAQVYDAVQDIALYLRKTLRYLEAQRGG